MYLNQYQSHKAQQTSAEQTSALFCDLLVKTQYYFVLVLPIPAPSKSHVLLAKHDCDVFSRSRPAPGRCSDLTHLPATAR